jgi:hypothetical protein
MPGFNLIAEFTLFPTKTLVADHFRLAGFWFDNLGTSMKLVVQDLSNEHGLQFTRNGIEITLPLPLPLVTLRLCTGGHSVDIEAFDSNSSPVRKKTVAANFCTDVQLSALEIASVRLTGGGDEAILSRISVVVCT